MLRDEPDVNPEDVRGARLVSDSGDPGVQVVFKPQGNRKFQRLTKQLYTRGNQMGEQQSLAAVLDDELLLLPTIHYNDAGLAGGIDGGGILRLGASLAAAKALTQQLNAGGLPVRFDRRLTETVARGVSTGLRSLLVAAAVALGLAALATRWGRRSRADAPTEHEGAEEGLG
jgi:preprotein translocase subunit SecD